MVDRKPLIVVGVVIATALAAALAFDSVYEISIRTRPPDPITATTKAPDASQGPAPAAFTLRLVDSGGVGIPLAQWGRTIRTIAAASSGRRSSKDRRTWMVRRSSASSGVALLRRAHARLWQQRDRGAVAARVDRLQSRESAGTPAGARSTTPGVRFAPGMPPSAPLRAALRLDRAARHAGVSRRRHADVDAAARPEHLRRLAPERAPRHRYVRSRRVGGLSRGLEELFDALPFDREW